MQPKVKTQGHVLPNMS